MKRISRLDSDHDEPAAPYLQVGKDAEAGAGLEVGVVAFIPDDGDADE